MIQIFEAFKLWPNIVRQANKAALGSKKVPSSGASGIRAHWEQFVRYDQLIGSALVLGSEILSQFTWSNGHIQKQWNGYRIE